MDHALGHSVRSELCAKRHLRRLFALAGTIFGLALARGCRCAPAAPDEATYLNSSGSTSGSGTACSDDGESMGQAESAEELVTAAAADFALSTLTGDAETAWKLFSTECREEVSETEFAEAFKQLQIGFEALGIVASELRVASIDVTHLTDSSATVKVEIVGAGGELPAQIRPNAVAMVREKDGWKVAGCLGN